MANENNTQNGQNEQDVRDSFFEVGTESQAVEEKTNVPSTPELDLDRPKKIPKKLKGIHIEKDVLDVFEAEQENRERGWGSQIVSDWMREKFVEYKLFEKHGIENLKKDK